ncbi:MAG: 3-phosphoshikimate 1-carboxyvinyltransferase [Actinobacteria bacterium]|nr:3-phosphoshikimate 1-carboxyvinyltransferase [Actinomycetota bacterium]
MTNWNAPFRGGLTAASKPIKATIKIPGSKSATNRALILAAIATTASTIRKPLSSRDTDLMVKGLQSLGCVIDQIKTDDGFDYLVKPKKLMGPTQIEVGNAGTVMRFLPPIAALATGLIHFDGDARSHERPIAPVIQALEQLGISIEHNGKYKLPPSLPHIEMTIQMLEKFGAKVEVTSNSWSIKPCELIGQDLVIEPDLSNAAPFMAAAMICGGSVSIKDWPTKTAQPGDQLRNIFTRMGAKIDLSENQLTISGSGQITGIDIDLGNVGELTPSIAAVASLASTPSTLRGIAHLRMHETDRLSALANEINNLGGSVTEGPGELLIKPTKMCK